MNLDPEEFEKILKSTSLEFADLKLQTLWPKILESYESQTGLKLGISCVYRSNLAQYELWKIGRTVPPIGPGYAITQCDGFKNPSKHNSKPSKAIDVYVYHPSGKITWERQFYEPLGGVAAKLGLKWGGDWSKFKDMPHLEVS